MTTAQAATTWACLMSRSSLVNPIPEARPRPAASRAVRSDMWWAGASPARAGCAPRSIL